MEGFDELSELGETKTDFYDLICDLNLNVFKRIKDEVEKEIGGEEWDAGVRSFKEKISLSKKFKNKVTCQKTSINDLKNDISQIKQSLISLIQEINEKEKSHHTDMEKFKEIEKTCNKNGEKIKKMKKTVKINKLKLETLKKIICDYKKNSPGKTSFNNFLINKSNFPIDSSYQYKTVNLVLRAKSRLNFRQLIS